MSGLILFVFFVQRFFLLPVFYLEWYVYNVCLTIIVISWVNLPYLFIQSYKATYVNKIMYAYLMMILFFK